MINTYTTAPEVTVRRERNGFPVSVSLVFDVRDAATDRSVLRVRGRAQGDPNGSTLCEGEGEHYVPATYTGPSVSWSQRDHYAAVAEIEALGDLADAREQWAEDRVRAALADMSVPSMDGTLTLFDPEAVLGAAERAAQATPLQRMYLSGALYGAPRA